MTPLLAKPVVEELRVQTQARVQRFFETVGRRPRLSVVLVGSNPASVIYTRKKGEAAVAVGMEHDTINLPDTSTPAEVKAVIDRLNADPSVDGILIQRPLPKGFKEEDVLYWVAPE